ncbi:MAG: YifB family Mg chelatase-like AAA ATPase [bacterium]|nr:YifB family Mg chelatase-like AAA ATPase [bacterium]
MHCQWLGGSLRGVEGLPVRIEVQMTRGLPGLTLVGLAGAATRESRERVLSAIRESGFQTPAGRMTVNLSPAEEPKNGSAFDLAMALGLLEVSEQIKPVRGRDWWFLGELGLDGCLLPIRGALALGLAARSAGAAGLIMPVGNAREAVLLDGIELGVCDNLDEVVAWLEGRGEIRVPAMRDVKIPGEESNHGQLDLCEVEGLPRVRRALGVAAAGGHNLLLIGSPGNGKSLMARILADLLPPLSGDENREVMTIRSVAGLPVSSSRRRPFRSPHHSVSIAGFLGSTKGGGRPGEITLAHRGLLFLDELPEFNRSVREALREPMEDGAFVLSRADGIIRWPADFLLVSAMNPCPCGQSLRGEEFCRCTPAQIRRYISRISGPLLDRIDLLVEVPIWRAESSRSAAIAGGESTAEFRMRVAEAASLRGGGAEPPGTLDHDLGSWLDGQLEAAGASYRLRSKTRAVARTVAALEGRKDIRKCDLLEALEYTFLLRGKIDRTLSC